MAYNRVGDLDKSLYWFDRGQEVLRKYSPCYASEHSGQLRGDFYNSNKSGRSRTERTEHSGMHWVECFIVKNNVCAARSGEFVVNIE